jgi:hypothetical protein
VKNERGLCGFSLTLGIGVAILAPVVAALVALVALMTDCSIDIVRQRVNNRRATPARDRSLASSR